MSWRFWDREERLRRHAAAWLARQRGPDADSAALERWLAADPAHARAYDNVKATWELAGGLAEKPVARTRGLPENSSTRLQHLPIWALPLGAAVMAIAIVAWTMFPRFDPVGHEGESPGQIVTALGEIRSVRLADGSTVTLDTDTALEVAYSSDNRRIRLTRGRARFAVVHDAARPFMVNAGGNMVIARGTVFDVALFDTRLDVLLLSGAIDIEISNEGSGAGNIRRTEYLNPGEQLSFTPEDPSPVSHRPVTSPPNWPSGMLEFADAPLREVLAEMNRYDQTKILLASPELGDLRVTGAYRAGETEQLARSLAAILSLSLRRSRDGNFVLETTH